MSQDPHTHVVCIRIQKHATPHSFFQLMLIIKHQRAVSHVKRKPDVFLISLNDTSEMHGRTMRQTSHGQTYTFTQLHIHMQHSPLPPSPIRHTAQLCHCCAFSPLGGIHALSLSLSPAGGKRRMHYDSNVLEDSNRLQSMVQNSCLLPRQRLHVKIFLCALSTRSLQT